MHKKFNHIEIEKKWQDNWKQSGIYNTEARDSAKDKEYVLVEWPYPSGNLHIGHWYAFAVVDIYVRARRMQGKQVLFPIGFDAFGLPAENAAIKHKLNPKEWTDKNIAYMTKQLESMGNAFSWDATTSSTDPSYYAWTQWMFTKFFEHDIAYRGKGIVNWCPGCQTVIANEQVKSNGACERSDDIVEKREMPQWMLRITKYADALIDDLETLPAWPEYIKEAQRQWIGRSQGAEIDFTLSTGDTLTIFTTRPDTLYGATYLVLAPEHDLVQTHRNTIKNWNDVSSYIKETIQKDEMTRTKSEKEKTGVLLEGITAINPVNGETIPVYIADYVLKGYGTGAIMAVPAHDERDFAFAQKYTLPITYVNEPNAFVTPTFNDNSEKKISASEILESIILNKSEPLTDSDCILINSGEYNGFSSEEAKIAITKKVGGRLTNTYRLRDWSIGRQRYWGVPIPIVYDPDGKPYPIPKEHLPWHLPTDVDFTPTGEPPLAKSTELKTRVTRIFGEGWTPEYETMDTFVDSSWYYLRYLDTKNTESLSSFEKQKEWMPIDVYFGGSEHTTMHVLYSRFWHKALYDLGLVADKEPYTKRINRGLVLGTDGNKMSKSRGNVLDPDEQVKLLGADTIKMFLAFMGPYGEPSNYPWNFGGVVGLRRFLERVYGLDEHIHNEEHIEVTKLLHKTIVKVTDDIALYKFNTAISALMVFINLAEKEGISNNSYKIFLQLVAPFAPHITDELWAKIGETHSIHTTAWPNADVSIHNDTITKISIQINGKMRGVIEVPLDSDQDMVLEILKNNNLFAEKIVGEITRIIFVPNRIINLVISGT